MFVMLKKENMPKAKEWSEKIKSEGFGLEIDTSYEEEEDSGGIYGFRPCKYYNVEDIGYELDILSRDENQEDFEEWDEEFPELKQYDLAVIFGIYEEDDVKAVMVAGVVLTKMTNGVFFDVDEALALDELYATAKQIDEEMKHSST
jgi:hypothetical protein